MASATIVAKNNGFLTSFNTTIPRLYITAETDTVQEFDQKTLRAWRDEGFEAIYLPYTNGGKGFAQELMELNNQASLGDHFAIVAFGDAAAACLEFFRKPYPRCCALIAYYPTSIPDTRKTFPMQLKLLVHLAGNEVGVNRNPEILGIQGKRKTYQRKINGGVGTGGIMSLAYPSYVYEDAEPGFAEHDLEEYDKVAERLAWSRSLGCLRDAFKAEIPIDRIWDEHVEVTYKSPNPSKLLSTLSTTTTPYVNYIPTMTGGRGTKALTRFYTSFFTSANPPSLDIKLISRTVGVDKVVDETFVTFKHTTEMPWILPNIPPTNKYVEIAVVSVVGIRGGKVAHEHVYWDQASVLVQVGLLDPKVVPKAFEKQGVERLPVVGKEGARKVWDEECEDSNGLIDE